MSRWRRAVYLFCAVALPDLALAHTASPGLGGFTGGMIHAVTEMPAPLALAGLGLLLGQLDDHAMARCYAAFAAGMCAGLTATLLAGSSVPHQTAMLLVTLAAAATVAAGFRQPGLLALLLALAGGLCFGVLAAPDPAPLATLLYAITGGVMAACWALIAVSAAVYMARQRYPAPWLRIGLRIAASWIVAISALMLALFMKSGATAL